MSAKVSCSFCNEEFSPSEIGEHLMSCGNKTDQCPNCQKRIRRAIFAYHYENSCANLDESESEVKAAVNRSEMPSTFQPNYTPTSSSRTLDRNDANTTTRSFDLSMVPGPTTVYISQQPASVGTMYIVCPYCCYGCNPSHSDTHQENCVLNPKNMEKKQQSQNNPTSNQNTGPLNHVDQFNDDADIPCENCNRSIKFRDYDNHIRACGTQNYQPILQQPQTIYRDDAPATARCTYCNHQYRIDFVQSHQRICPQNPPNTLESQLRAIYRPPPLYTPHYSS